jgi:DNA-binding PadR family transcriptional regulator
MRKRSPEEEARRSSLIALFCLMEEHLSGYALRQRLKKWHISESLPISPSTIYRSLDRLEQEGSVVSSVLTNGNYPQSKVYRITPAGRKAYRCLLDAEAKFERSAYALSTFLGCASYLTAGEREVLVRQWQSDAREAVAKLQARLNDRTVGATYGQPFAQWLLCDHEKSMLEAEIAWLDKYLEITG